VLQVGIGPIVTASIVLQLLGGANLLGLDTDNDPRDQVLYQGLQKLLVVIVTAATAAPMVFTGAFLPASDTVGNAL
jgi:preprotein translocase subunit SecY